MKSISKNIAFINTRLEIIKNSLEKYKQWNEQEKYKLIQDNIMNKMSNNIAKLNEYFDSINEEIKKHS